MNAGVCQFEVCPCLCGSPEICFALTRHRYIWSVPEEGRELNYLHWHGSSTEVFSKGTPSCFNMGVVY